MVAESANPLTRTLSVVDLSKMDQLGAAMKKFSAALDDCDSSDRDKLTNHAEQTQDFMRHDESLSKNHPFKSYRDLGHFAQLVHTDQSLESGALRKAASEVFKAVSEAVVKNHTSVGYEKAHGISMNIAAAGQDGPGSYYESLDLAKATGWTGKLEG